MCCLKTPWHKQQSRNLNTQMWEFKKNQQACWLIYLLILGGKIIGFLFHNGRLIDCPRPARSQGSNHWHLSWSLPLFQSNLCPASFHEKRQKNREELSLRCLKMWRGFQPQVGWDTNLLESLHTKADFCNGLQIPNLLKVFWSLFSWFFPCIVIL